MEVRKSTKFNQFCLFFCWKTDDLEIFGRLPVRGYCPGQTMNLKLDVINKSCQDVLYFLVHFIQVSVHWDVRKECREIVLEEDFFLSYTAMNVEIGWENVTIKTGLKIDKC